ncbi:non-specific lipid transfer protein GPI-anchored 7 [Solanum dulcamara]|uniref:non-specific lipid transfer protein GPI-anchored 7 n=1 Tax=Solanum dulcamara TaxID=45834 RepID=UPI0024866415|nr:non-specific lipid transfer protein GPI-anchored 7 [Solanum dulcamara]
MVSSKLSWLITVAMTAALLLATTTEAQTTSCASKLVPCAPYLNSTSKPPASCCDPLREAVTKDLQCLCKLYENPTLLPSLGINVTQIIALTKNCNIPGDLTACKAASPSSSSPSEITPPGN